MLHNFQKGVRGIVFQPINCRSRIEKCYAFLVQKRNDFIHFEALVFGVHEMVLVAKPNLPFDAPVVVDEVGVEKVHAPALLWRRKTAEEQDSRVLWEKRFQRMIFYHFLFYQEFENAEKTEVILLNLRKNRKRFFIFIQHDTLQPY